MTGDKRAAMARAEMNFMHCSNNILRFIIKC